MAAGVAWFLTHTVLGHPQPFFAPIAAVVALAVGTGGRGTQAAQMLAGVALKIRRWRPRGRSIPAGRIPTLR